MPTSLLFDPHLSPAAAHTWAQLRALAWGKTETPALSIHQLANLTGKKPSTLYGHMAALRDRDALRWRPADRGTLIVSFPEPDNQGEEESSQPVLSGNLEKPSLISPLDSNIDSDIDSEKEEKRGSTFQESGETFQNSGKPFQKSRKPFQKSGELDSAAANLYRTLTSLAPNPSQLASITASVTDLVTWQSTLEHWLSHGWNPRNLPGILNLYQSGGAAGCRYCQKPAPPAQSASALDQIRKEYQNGKP